jgi:hypothetical protein
LHRVTQHPLRHSAAFRHDVDSPAIALLLGHESIETTLDLHPCRQRMKKKALADDPLRVGGSEGALEDLGSGARYQSHAASKQSVKALVCAGFGITDAVEFARQIAAQLHTALVEDVIDPWDCCALVIAEAKRRDIDVEPTAKGATVLDGGRAIYVPKDRLIVRTLRHAVRRGVSDRPWHASARGGNRLA